MNRCQLLRLLFSVFVGQCLSATGVIAGFPGETQVDRTISVAGKKTLPLIVNGVLKVELVVPDSSSLVAKYAATEAQVLLTRAFGKPVPVVATPTQRAKRGMTSLVIGDCPLAKQHGMDVSSLSRDAYIIRRVGSMVFIAGRDDAKVDPSSAMTKSLWAQMYERGSLLGVYEFLERFLGVRFYFPGELGTVVPRHTNLALEETIHIVDRPDYSVRKISMHSGQWYQGDLKADHKEGKNQNYYRLRLETRYIPNSHGLSRLGYVRRYGKSHPEYFALKDNGKRHNDMNLPHPGQLCFSSGIRDRIFEDAKAYLSGVSAEDAGVLTERFGYVWDQSGFQQGFFNIMPQDAFYPCRCEKCQQHYSRGPKATSLHVWALVNEVAKRLKDERVPGYLTMMAYGQYQNFPPESLEDNVLVMTAVRGPWADRYPEMQASEDGIVRKWQALGKRKTWLWNYANKYGPMDLTGVPAITPNAIGKYYQKMPEHILGAFMQSSTDHYLFNYLNYYVFAKVSWDNQADLKALLDEHYQLMFGNARLPMETFFTELERLWLTKTYGTPIDTPLGPTATAPSTYELWEKIYSPAKLKSFHLLFDQAESLVVDDEMSLARVRLMRQQIFGPLLAAATRYHETTQPAKDRSIRSTSREQDRMIKIDGRLNDSEWKISRSVRLIESGQHQGSDLQLVKTVVRALHDQSTLYFSFVCQEPAIQHMNAPHRARDDHGIRRDSSVGLFISPNGQADIYYEFVVNAAGSATDWKNSRAGEPSTREGSSRDVSWNSQFKSRVSRAGDQWTAEIAIPRQAFPSLDPNHSRIYFYRHRSLTPKYAGTTNYARLYGWGPRLQSGFHDVTRFGRLRFDAGENRSLVLDGTFFTAPKGRFAGAWSFADKKQLLEGQNWALDSDDFLSDGHSLQLVNHAEGKRMIATQILPTLEPNTKYRIVFHIRTENVVPLKKGGGACVNIYGDKNQFFPRNWYRGDMPWTRQSFTLTTGEKTNRGVKSYMRLCLNDASGTVWFDDVSLEKVD